MYEGKITTDGENPVCDTPGAAGELRALSWPALAARLAAAWDYRSVIDRGRQADGGSFNPVSALHLASIGDGKPGVNPIALANGKMVADKDFVVSSDAENGDRGR